MISKWQKWKIEHERKSNFNSISDGIWASLGTNVRFFLSMFLKQHKANCAHSMYCLCTLLTSVYKVDINEKHTMNGQRLYITFDVFILVFLSENSENSSQKCKFCTFCVTIVQIGAFKRKWVQNMYIWDKGCIITINRIIQDNALVSAPYRDHTFFSIEWCCLFVRWKRKDYCS